MVNYSSRPLLGQVLVGPFQSVSVLCQSKVSQIKNLTKASKKEILGSCNFHGQLLKLNIFFTFHGKF